MAEILHSFDRASKRLDKELALETGKLAIVASHMPITGPLLEYSLVLTPPKPVTVEVSARPVIGGGSKRRLDRVFIQAPGPMEEQRSFGQIRAAVAHIVLADVATLYCAGNGRLWNRPEESTRASQACNDHSRTGGRYVTDFGADAVALRLGRGPIRASVRVTEGAVEIQVIDEEEE